MSAEGQNFQPNDIFLQQLTSMGIPRAAAEEALFCTGNKSLDEAINYVFSDDNDPLDLCPLPTKTQNVQEHQVDQQDHISSDDDESNYYKMTFVVNHSLKMGIGKIAAQVAHACLALYREMMEQNMEDLIQNWEAIGEKKIVLKGDDTDHLVNLYEKAKSHNIVCHLVHDAGHTQIAPGSATVLGIFGLEDDVDKIAGKLKLL
ncbi:unnamed protein product [Brassicogethes aeneus]|uniref:peptidyl-tRNA hydrolase n=1 Tax=Brassicogethes aeneus TaxID=1431903 RepID=A0A9P0B1G8_BRAAE|nr:unnamed protein product [Brassicogethes aeneus]